MLLERQLTDISGLADILAQYAASHDKDGSFPAEAFAELGRRGLLRTPPLGDIKELLALLVEVGQGDLNAGRIYEGHVNAVWLVETYGSRQTREVARKALDGGGIFGVWNTDLPRNPLELNDNHLQGSKNFASGVDGLSHAIVTVTRDDARHMILAPLDGLPVDRSWWKPVGMRSSGSHVVDFTGLKVEDHFRIGSPDDYIAQPWFSAGALRFLAVQTGGMKAVFTIALDHLTKTNRAENPFQAHRIARMADAVETALLWLSRCADLWTKAKAQNTPESAAKLLASVNAARGAVERSALDVLTFAEQAIGAAGMIAPHPFERVMRDLRTYLRQPNPDGAASAFAGAVVAGEWQPMMLGVTK